MEDVDESAAFTQSTNNPAQSETIENTRSSASNNQSTNNDNHSDIIEEQLKPSTSSQLEDIPLKDMEYRSNTLDLSNYYQSLVQKEKEMNKTIGFWQLSLNKMTMAMNNLEIEKQNIEKKPKYLKWSCGEQSKTRNHSNLDCQS